MVCVVSLWVGHAWLRWFVAIWALSEAALYVLASTWVMYHMAIITPPEKAMFFMTFSLRQFWFPMLKATIYLLAGLMLILSPGIRVFLDHQAKSVDAPWPAWIERLLERFGMDRASRAFRRRLRDCEDRRRHPVLTRDKLQSLEDYQLEDAIVGFVQFKINGDYAHEFQIVSSLPAGFQAVYSTWWVNAEVSNGGFHQFFYNRGIEFAFMALEGYKRFGDEELAILMARAIDLYLQEEPEQLLYRTRDLTEMLEKYVAARDVSRLPELDSLFYRVQSGSSAAQYIRAHLDEFVVE